MTSPVIPNPPLSRRGVLGAGLLGALPGGNRRTVRTRPGVDVSPQFILTGAASADGALVHSTLALADKGAAVDLAVWRADGGGQIELVGKRTADEDAIVRHEVTGKEPNTAYYARLVSDDVQVGERVRFRTLPAAGGSWSRKIAVVSCQSNASNPLNTQLAWDDVRSWAPDDVWHLGDWGYWGQEIPAGASYKRDLAHYTKSMRVQDSIRATIQSAALNVVTISDHELTANGDPENGIHNSPETIRELVAFQKLFPVRRYGDTRSPRRGRYFTYDIGSDVRVIVTDFRSPDRSNADKHDGPDKTMFGKTQLDWIFDTLDTSKLNLLVSETSWLADPNNKPGGPRTDKPWTYYQEQKVIARYIEGGGYRVAWIGGDRHYVGYLRGDDDGSGVFNTRGGFPCYISSGMSKNQLPLQSGELMTWQFGAGPDLTRWVCGYLRLTMVYDASSSDVSLHGQGRAVLDTTKPRSQWTISDIPGGTAVDSWRLG